MKGIPVTSVARTLLDLAEVVSQRQLQRAIEEAERLRLFDLTAVERLCARSPGRHGLRPLRAAIEEAREPDPVDPSELERLFVDLCRDARLPPPEINVEVAGLQVDALWRDTRLVVELDSRAFHDNRAAFEEDRMRDIALQLAGYRPVRITHRRLTRKPKEVVAALREMRAA